MMNQLIDLAYEIDDREEFVNSETASINHHHHQIQFSEAETYNIMQSPTDSTNQKAKMAEVLMSLPPLGLKLHKPASFMNMIETKLFPEERPNFSAETNPKKASNADIFHLRIGTWQRVAQHKEDLVAKCYFAKRKLMWEILENGLKRKIQMHWEHILAIRAEIEDDRPGILEIELSQPPLFFRETEPQPRKHTLWEASSDFTGGQAMICRRHYLRFPPGALDKLYEKLLQCEPRFSQMTQMPFPSLRSPYFDSDFYNFVGCDLSFGCNDNGLQNYTNSFNRESTFPSTLRSVKAHHDQEYRMICDPSSVPCDFSPTSVMDLSQPLEEPFSIEDVSTPNPASWGQHVDNYDDIEQQRDLFQHRFSTEANLIASDQNPHSVAMMDNESHYFNYQGIEEVDIDSENYEQESISSENTDCRFYPQYVNWTEAENKLVGYANYSQNQIMTGFMGNQNLACPWM